ncbi:MAG: hypothetical protein PWQ09_224 [Candidatus Cloacimonadota bacterium]|nr:hypothetical protein [Candidatus Cloacimonadota bacterium]
MQVLEKAKRFIKAGEADCIIIKNDEIIRAVKGKGISPLISFYENEPEVLKNAFVIDKVVGKAAAVIITLAGVEKVYGEVISEVALNYLKEQNHLVDYGKKVEIITNLTGDGMCPLEETVIDIEDAEVAYYQLKEKIKELKNI